MMSISPRMSAGQAGGYYSREDYYLRGIEQGENSLWYGKGAEELGLAGKVGEEEFRALCQGKHPFTGLQIVHPKPTKDKETGEEMLKRRARNDCTFSAPHLHHLCCTRATLTVIPSRMLLANGVDPGREKQVQKTAALASYANTFEAVALEWHEAFKST